MLFILLVLYRNVDPSIGESEIRTIFEAFGSIASCAAAPSSGAGGALRTFLIRYDAAEEVVRRTADSMNGFDLAGRPLQCSASAWSAATAQQAPAAADAAPTAVLLRNMVSIDELNDPELKDEIAEEAQNYGALKETEFAVEGNEVNVVLRYHSAEDAQRALKAMHGRVFAGNKIHAELKV